MNAAPLREPAQLFAQLRAYLPHRPANGVSVEAALVITFSSPTEVEVEPPPNTFIDRRPPRFSRIIRRRLRLLLDFACLCLRLLALSSLALSSLALIILMLFEGLAPSRITSYVCDRPNFHASTSRSSARSQSLLRGRCAVDQFGHGRRRIRSLTRPQDA